MSDPLDLLLYLGSDATDGYGPRPIPSAIDEKVADLITSIKAMGATSRDATLSIMDERHGLVLIAFAERMSSLAVRTKRDDLLASAFVAIAIATRLINFKEILPVMSLLYKSASKLGADVKLAFRECGSVLGGKTFSNLFSDFLNRADEDRSIEAMGYEEGSDADGFRYTRTW